MNIESEMTLEESVACNVRAWYAFNFTVTYIIKKALAYAIFLYCFLYLVKSSAVTIGVCIVTLLISSAYAHTIGFRRKICKQLIKRLGKDAFPMKRTITIDNEGIITKTPYAETKLLWKTITSISTYKHYVEFKSITGILWIKADDCPSIEEIKCLQNTPSDCG